MLCRECWKLVPPEVRTMHLKIWDEHGEGSVEVNRSAVAIIRNLVERAR